MLLMYSRRGLILLYLSLGDPIKSNISDNFEETQVKSAKLADPLFWREKKRGRGDPLSNTLTGFSGATPPKEGWEVQRLKKKTWIITILEGGTGKVRVLDIV